MSPIFAHILTKEEFGQVTIYSSWMGLITIFLTLNLYAGSFQTAMVKFEKERDGYPFHIGQDTFDDLYFTK